MSNIVNDDQMSPDASPGAAIKKSGVRRVNNWPMYLLGGALLSFLVIMMLVAADRAEQQNQPVEKATEKGGNSSLFAQAITGSHMDGLIPDGTVVPPSVPADAQQADTLVPPQPTGVQVVRPDNLDAPPTPPGSYANDGEGRSVQDDEMQRIRMAKMQMFQEAVKAKTSVQVVAPRSSGSSGIDASAPISQADALARIAAARQRLQTEAKSDPTAAYKARLAQIRGGNGGGAGGGGMGGSDDDDESPFLTQASTNGNRNSYNQFDKQEGGDRWALKSKVEAPRSPFEIRAGFVLPATLISGINSDLPGQIMAQVSQDVYDTATGKHKLVPQGSRLLGSYSSDVAYGQSRVLIAWQRITFPDGKVMDIGSMPGADSAGYSGFTDQTNNHLVRLFGSAFLMSGITAGISLSQNNGSEGGFNQQPTASSAMSEALGQQLGQVTGQMIAKNLNVSPTLEIRPGYRFNVIVTKDMTFSKPYKSFDY